MVEDNAIKAPKSPFAMRENEIKVFDGKDGYASINQVVFKIDKGYINEVHFQILEIINIYLKFLCQHSLSFSFGSICSITS